MFVTKDESNALKIPRDMFINDSGTLKRVRELWVNDNGTLRYVYGGNVTNYTGNHPYWERSLNSDFNENDGAVPCWNTFWSSGGSSGTYEINNNNDGRASVQIPLGAIETEIFPPAPGFYEFTTETRGIFCNFTSGNRTVQTFNSADLNPYNRVGADGVSYRWNISAPGITQSDTTINLINPLSPTTFEINRQPVASGTGIVPSISRTYPSSFVPATTGYTRYFGFTTLQSNYEIRISQNTSYTMTINCVGGTTINTNWKFGCLTGTSQGMANFFTAGSQIFQSTNYTSLGQFTFSFTSPSGALFARPFIRVDYDSGDSDTLASLPRQYSFDWIRFS
jgi:hypothetical protein